MAPEYNPRRVPNPICRPEETAVYFELSGTLLSLALIHLAVAGYWTGAIYGLQWGNGPAHKISLAAIKEIMEG
jgi:hypothetical protein